LIEGDHNNVSPSVKVDAEWRFLETDEIGSVVEDVVDV